MPFDVAVVFRDAGAAFATNMGTYLLTHATP